MNISSLQKGLVLDMPLELKYYNSATKRLTDAALENHGISANAVNFTTDRMGQADRAISLNGTNDLVRIPDSPSLSPTSAMSAMIWVNGAAQSNKGIIVHYDAGASQRAHRIGSSSISPYDNIKIIITDDGIGGAGHSKQYHSSIVAFDSTWHLVGFTFDAGILKLYVDRVEDTNPTKSVDDAITTIHNSTADLIIGSFLSLDTPSNFYVGDFARPRMWNRALTPTEWALAFDQYRPKVVI